MAPFCQCRRTSPSVRPRSASECHHEADAVVSGSAGVHTRRRSDPRPGPRRSSCSTSGVGWPGYSGTSSSKYAVILSPQPPPPEHLSVDDIERLVRRGQRRRGPENEMPRKNARVSDVGGGGALLRRPRKDERTPCSLIATPCRRRVSKPVSSYITHGVADHRVRPVHRPGEPAAGGRLEQDVLL